MTRKPTKLQQGTELARQFKDLSYPELETKIVETVHCGRTTARKAIAAARKQAKTSPVGEAGITVLDETPKEPALIVKEIPSELKTLPEQVPSEMQEEPEIPRVVPEPPREEAGVFKTLCRSQHLFWLSKKGILGKQYGNEPEACIAVADSLYEYLLDKYGAEALEKGNIYMLMFGYAGLIGDPAQKFLRRPKEKKEKKKQKTEKT